MDGNLSRRALLVAGLAFLAAGCRVRTGGGTATPTPPRPPSPPRPPVDVGGQWYEIAPGDTLTAISRRSGIALDRITAANQGVRAADLKPGMRLWLPGATPQQLQQVVATRRRPGEAVPPEDEDPPEAGAGYVLVPRSAWTKQAVGANNNPMNGVSRITVHHTGEHAGLADLPEVEVLRRIERYHRNERKWCAIGYHFIVGKDGRVYEGRPARYQGAHVLGENEHNLGISVAGDFMKRLPNARQLRALEAFLDDMRKRYRVAPARVFGHRDLNQSLCPGDALYAWLRKYKRAI